MSKVVSEVEENAEKGTTVVSEKKKEKRSDELSTFVVVLCVFGCFCISMFSRLEEKKIMLTRKMNYTTKVMASLGLARRHASGCIQGIDVE